MIISFRRRVLKGLAAVAMGGIAVMGLAQNAHAEYPDKPITLLVGYAAGGQTDLVGRAAANVMSDALGVPVNVVNRPGAGGAVAAKELHGADPDGYTIMFHANSVVNAFPFLMKRVTYTPDDFEWAGFITAYQAGLVTHKDAPFGDLDGFVAWARENPGFSFGSLSPAMRMTMTEIAKKEGLDANIVPLKGGGEMVNAVLGKQVALAASGGIHKRYPDEIKMLAALTTFRHPSDPDVKSIDEYGYSMAMDTRAGLFAPKGTPADILAKLSDALGAAQEDPGFVKATSAASIPIMFLDADAAREEMVKTYASHGEIYRRAGIEPR